jgi:hypothetical protein
MRLRLPTGFSATGIAGRNFGYFVWHLTGAASRRSGRESMRSTRLPRNAKKAILAVLSISMAPLLLAACGGNSNIARAEQCREQITLSLSPGVFRTDRVEDRLQDDADVNLTFLRSTSPTLHQYELSARGKDPGCRSALTRLRQDSRVRFAEPDRRRTVNGFGE